MKKSVLLAPLTLALALVACTGPQAPQPPAGPNPAKASVNGYVVNADQSVNLNVSALDSQDTVLTSGIISDITVTDTALAQGQLGLQAAPAVTASKCGDITSVSGDFRAGILLDASGSMADNDPEKKRAEAAKLFIERLSGTAAAAVTSFSGYDATSPYTELTVHQDFTTDKGALKAAVDEAAVAGGGTPLWEATQELVQFVSTKTGNRVGVVLTDGAANGTDNLAPAIAAAKAAGMRLFMIGLGSPDDLDTADMQQAAQQTGGTYALANDAAALNTAFGGVFNATQGAGCIKLVVQPAPIAGQILSGRVNFKVNGAALSAPFSVQY